MALIKKLRKAKKEASAGEKPEPVRTHLRNMIIVPEMIGSIIGVYNGKTFNQVTPQFHPPGLLYSLAGLRHEVKSCCLWSDMISTPSGPLRKQYSRLA